MGAQQSSTSLDEKDLASLSDRLAQHATLRDWVAETPLVPGSGRFMKTYRIRQKNAAQHVKGGAAAASSNNNAANNNTTNTASSSQQHAPAVVAVLKTGWVLAPPPVTTTAAVASSTATTTAAVPSSSSGAASDQGDSTATGGTAATTDANTTSSAATATATSTTTTSGAPASEPATTAASEQQQQQQTVEQLLAARARELQHLQAAVAGQSHVAPFVAWFSSQHSHARSLLQQTSTSLTCVYLLRPHFYTTLADRLASRPFLQVAEKLFLASQLLQALAALHQAGVVHGFLTTTNVAVTATGWLVLTDLATAVKDTPPVMADDDPTDFLYYFAARRQADTSTNNNSSTTKTTAVGDGGQRCYLAPERFGNNKRTTTATVDEEASAKNAPTKGATSTTDASAGPSSKQVQKSLSFSSPLTPAMDIFSAGCVLTEVFLNGETCLELGDLLEYRAHGSIPSSLQQKFGKIERSAVRAVCKHMLQLDPAQRLSAAAYWERWNETEPFPASFALLTQLVEQVTATTTSTANNATSINSSTMQTADARLARAAQVYGQVLWETVGVRDDAGQAYLDRVLGFPSQQTSSRDDDAVMEEESANKPSQLDTDAVLAETEALLALLEAGDDEDKIKSVTTTSNDEPSSQPKPSPPSSNQVEERSPDDKNSLLIYLQVIAATVRHVQRPGSKLVALQLLKRLAEYSSDEARLQRIVPVTISLLQDQDAIVRALSVQVLTFTLSVVESFSPSDSQIFPQYIFKRVAHLISDPSLVARLAFARSIAVLAETAQRFLDISHAVRLHEAVGSGVNGSGGKATPDNETAATSSDGPSAIFGDDVHKLLDTVSRSSSRLSLNEATEGEGDNNSVAARSDASSAITGGRTLISSTYNTELAGLHETISRWVVQLTTDQSNHASLSKRAVLHDLGRLCVFFGLDGVMAFILPQILAFLNERKDWELRCALFQKIPSVCRIIGRAATEEFVLPCVEIGLVDSEEQVISRALGCLEELVRLGLLARFAIVGNTSSSVMTDTTTTKGASSLVSKYGVLLLHPSEDIRSGATKAFAAMCKAIGPLDGEVYLIPQLASLFRYQPAAVTLTTAEGMMQCIDFPWSREKFTRELELVASSMQGIMPQTPGTWTSIGISVTDGAVKKTVAEPRDTSSGEEKNVDSDTVEPQVKRFREYLLMLLKHTASFSAQERPFSGSQVPLLSNAIEGSVKLAQNILFPKQNGREQKGIIPGWYAALRDEVESSGDVVSEDSAIRSVSSLGQVYGLSIMGPASGTSDIVVDASDESEGKSESSKDVLATEESMNIEAAFAGRWGPETTLDPEIVDTCLLMTKLKAMQVPPLPPQLGGHTTSPRRLPPVNRDSTSTKSWKPKMNAMMATSSSVSGHTAPVMRLAVSADQRFFISGSHDGTCRVWEMPQIEDSPGILESSTTYQGHLSEGATRVNDIAMLEGSHSIVSGSSDGSVHVWRVDMVATASNKNTAPRSESPRVVGTSAIRKAHPNEGEVLAVSHFNSPSASVATYATQKGTVHSWDLRCAQEPFALRHSASLGNLTAMALGGDRNWLVSGTSGGYITLWDIRFQQPVKLWRHSRGASISRLATSYILSPQHWGTNDPSRGARPFVFAASGSNECGMFDVLTGNCQGCFRAMEGDSRNLNGHVVAPPTLEPVRIAPRQEGNMVKSSQPVIPTSGFPSSNAINCMIGSVGTGDQSYLITGGGDSMIRYWDFSLPSKCFVVSGQSAVHPRPSYERVDFENNGRLLLCRETVSLGLRDTNTVPRRLFRGLKKPEHYHSDSVEDLKVIDNSCLISCSRDCTVKVWR